MYICDMYMCVYIYIYIYTHTSIQHDNILYYIIVCYVVS